MVQKFGVEKLTQLSLLRRCLIRRLLYAGIGSVTSSFQKTTIGIELSIGMGGIILIIVM